MDNISGEKEAIDEQGRQGKEQTRKIKAHSYEDTESMKDDCQYHCPKTRCKSHKQNKCKTGNKCNDKHPDKHPDNRKSPPKKGRDVIAQNESQKRMEWNVKKTGKHS